MASLLAVDHDNRGVVAVTGAAGAIGAATAAAFIERGGLVHGIDRVAAGTVVDDGLHDEVPAVFGHDRYRHHVVDVTDRDQLMAVAGDIGAVHHLVVVAGGAGREPGLGPDPAMVPLEEFRANLEHNLVAAFATLQAFLPGMRSLPGNRTVTFTSSINGQRGIGLHGYSAAKAGVESLVRTLAGPLGADGIRVNAVAPGTIVTPRTARAWAHDPTHFETLAQTTALGACGRPDDVAAVFVAVAELEHLTGQVLTVDGGQTARWR